MPKIEYESPSGSVLANLSIVADAERICASYAAQGYDLTLRGLYYQFVARGLFPDTRKWVRKPGTTDSWAKADPSDPAGTKNASPNYKWLGGILNDARLAGMIDWNHLTDSGRAASQYHGWSSPAAIVESSADSYTIDKWTTQPRIVEVWVEKDALNSVVSRACQAREVTSFACKGYVSASAMWRAARRIERYHQLGQGVTILHLGDHDPSGIDMTRDITDRLMTMVGADNGRAGRPQPFRDWGDGRQWLEINRIALNMDQIEQYDPPSDPAKLGDSRSQNYIDTYDTDQCWELDALDPPVLDALISGAIEEIVDDEAYQARVDEQTDDQAKIRRVVERWTDLDERWDEIEELLNS
jgi:hypothetical protein